MISNISFSQNYYTQEQLQNAGFKKKTSEKIIKKFNGDVVAAFNQWAESGSGSLGKTSAKAAKKLGLDYAFVDSRLKEAKKKTNLNDAIRTAVGKSMGEDIVIACMDFSFIGGSMGSVVGEKISRAIDYSLKKNIPLIIISKSGGARMMEAALSLMQLAKTSAKLAQLAKAKIPYISLCTDPTTGGTTASFAMLGDINISEPGALIGFAGPRVVRDTTGKDLPEGFQKAEFVLDHGFLDFITHRKDLKKKINLYIDLILNKPIRE